MAYETFNSSVRVFSTCPQSKDHDASSYRQRVADVARWSEDIGCAGILVYTDNGLVDPWLVSQTIIENTTTLSPLVAVQPLYMHPYAAAKMVASLSHMHGRRLWLNMLAGGFKNDLIALGDDTPHDERYARTTEYTLIMKALLSGDGPVTFHGRYYSVSNLRMTPPVPADLAPGFLMSGASEAGLAAARDVGAIAVKYPRSPKAERENAAVPPGESGVRIGIIARADVDEAWNLARLRFPEDRKGEITHKIAMKTSDSQWHRQLSEVAAGPAAPDEPYWLHPFQTYKTFCPYLVGSYERVAEEIAGYMRRGFQNFILDIPPTQDELAHIHRTFMLATKQAQALPQA